MLSGKTKNPVPVKPAKAKKETVSYRLPTNLKVEMLQKMISVDQYGLRDKSRWVGEAINSFLLEERSWKDQTLDGDMVKENDEKDVIYVTKDIKKLLKDRQEEMLQYLTEKASSEAHPERTKKLKASESSIVRAAIIWRMYDLRMPVVNEQHSLL